MIKKYLEAAKIVGTHGIRGEMKLDVWCDSPDILCGIKSLFLDDKGENKLKVVSARVHKSMVILKADGINTIEEADKYRGKLLFADRNDLKKDDDAFFIQDLIGCKVSDAKTEEIYGVVSDIFKTAANDVYEVKTGDGKTVLIPGIKDIIVDIDPQNEIIRINPMKGLFDDED